MQLLQLAERLRFVHASSGEDLEQHEAEGVDVAPDARGLAGELLRRHVLRRTGSHGGVVCGAREAEIGDPDVPVAVDHHVGRLQIAVQDAAIVSGGNPRAELPREVDRLVLWDAADAAEQRRKILAVDILHREEAAAVRVAEVVEPADVLVRHLSRDAQLVVKLREPRRIGGGAIGQELQRDRLIEGEILGAIHFTHAAAPEQRDEAVAARDNGPGCQPLRRGRARPAARRICEAGSRERRPDRRVVIRKIGHGGNSTGRVGSRVACEPRPAGRRKSQA